MNTLLSLLGSPIINKVLDIVKPYLPQDETTKLEIQAKLEQIEIESLKEKGNYLDKLDRLKDFIIPAYLLVLLIMFSLNFLKVYIYSLFGVDVFPTPPSDVLVDINNTIIMFLFGSKTVSRFSPTYVEKKYK